MTLEEIKLARKKLSDEILNSLHEFEKSTACSVANLHLQKADYHLNESSSQNLQSAITNVLIDIDF